MPNPEINSLAKQLRHPSRKRRQTVLSQIRDMPHEDAIKTLIGLLEENSHLRATLNERMWVTVIADVFFGLFRWFLAPPGADLRTPLIFPLLVVFLVGAGYTLIEPYVQASNQLILTLVTEYKDSRLISPLLKGWRAVPISGTPLINRSLEVNLPLLTPEIAATFLRSERVILRTLIQCPSPTLQIVVLETLVRIEDMEAIPNLQRAIEHSDQMDAGVKAAADTCLETLNAIKSAETANKTLLRASHDTTGAETLLRVSVPTTVKEAKELLRPDESENPENRP